MNHNKWIALERPVINASKHQVRSSVRMIIIQLIKQKRQRIIAVNK